METKAERVTYINGRWVPESKASVHIYDSQFMFGDAVFEMHRTFGHRHFLLDEHIDRLFASMRSLYIPIDKTREEIKGIFDELMQRNRDHFVDDEYRFMVNVSRGPLPIYKDVFTLELGDDWNKPTWIFNDWPLSKTARHLAHFYDLGANAVIVSQRQIPAQYLDPKVKNRSRVHYKLADIEASHHGKNAVALLLDDDGFIAEGTGSNFIMIKDGAIVVPELRNMLRGCSMMYVLNVIAPQLRIPVIEKNIMPYDVLEADEAMFTGTFVNLLPCNRLNGRPLKGCIERQQPMGPVTQAICKQWSENVGLDFIEQIKRWAPA
jgi:branched-chain amino acid aminotransferase